MAHTRLIYHIVFCPKHRHAVIPVEHERMLYSYLWGIVRNVGGVLYRMGGMPDHIHMLLQLPPTTEISDFMRDMKVSAGKFMRAHPTEFPAFTHWASGYCAISCAADDIPAITAYINGQKEHHKRVSFRDELIAWMKEEGVAFEEQYLLGEEE